jgi:L-xylulokinase
VQALRVTGGPAHSDVWMQMLADVSGLAIELPQVEETGCFGAALAALVGTGVYRFPRRAARPQHDIRTLSPTCAPTRPTSANTTVTSID